MFAEKVVTFEPYPFQKSYNLSFIMWCARNFSAIFGVDPRDRASDVKGLPGDIVGRGKVGS